MPGASLDAGVTKVTEVNTVSTLVGLTTILRERLSRPPQHQNKEMNKNK
jgi:hypothetical protein